MKVWRQHRQITPLAGMDDLWPSHSSGAKRELKLQLELGFGGLECLRHRGMDATMTPHVQAIQKDMYNVALTKHRFTEPHSLDHTSKGLSRSFCPVTWFLFPAETFHCIMQKHHAMIHYNLNRSKTYTLLLFSCCEHWQIPVIIPLWGGPLVWPGGTDPGQHPGRLKQNVNDLCCSFITEHFSSLSLAPCSSLSLSRSTTSVILEKKKGGGVVGWGGSH